ncbi:MAG TPA: hypothetical protein VLA56_15975 [Pseudomonadales bacterium]|nr:hypothetical protein [Pseudomonadales bacterium]
MSDLHIDDFCKDIARILNQLYLQFPRKTTIYVEDIAGADEPDEFGLHSPRHMACLGALIWLSEEGYIRFESGIRQEAVDQAVLAGRSFTVLSSMARAITEEEGADLGSGLPATLRSTAAEGFGEQIPESVLRDQRTNINRLRLALRSRSSERLRAVTLDILAQARA